MLRSSRRGAVLVLALLLGLVVSVVAVAALLLSSQLATATSTSRDQAEALRLAEGASELVRNKLLEDFQRAGLTRSEWLRRLLLPPGDPQSRYSANRDRPQLQAFLLVSAERVAGQPGTYYADPGAIYLDSPAPAVVVARLFAVSSSTTQDLEVRATAYLRAASQTVARSLQGRSAETFDFALLAREPNCQFCHLQLQGNVGALLHFRPGFEHVAADKSAHADAGFDENSGTLASGPSSLWGDGDREGILEDSGSTSSENALASQIRGDIYANQLVTNDKTDLDFATGRASRLNGVTLEADRPGQQARINLRYPGPAFYLLRGRDVDQNGRSDDFPPFDSEALRREASGSVRGQVQAVPFGSLYSSRFIDRLGPVVSGQAVLLGEAPSAANHYCETASAPLLIEGDLFVEGDVVLRGCVSGQGQIYAGRNLYIAGNVVYQHPPGSFGNYTASSDPDAAARADIAAGRDSLLLAANGSIVLGDYTDQEADSSQRLYRERAGERHIRSRFHLDTGQKADIQLVENRVEELVRTAGGQHFTLAGEAVGESQIRPLEAYEALIRPVFWKHAQGKLQPWLSDGDYRALLGQAVPGGVGSVSSWRIDASTYQLQPASGPPDSLLNLVRSGDPAKIDLCRRFFENNLRFTNADASAASRAQAVIAQLQSAQAGWNEAAKSFLDTAGGYDRQRWMLDLINFQSGAADPYAVVRPVQIERVDALLYSARRIAGHVGATNLTVNGGLVAPEVAITAPGAGWLASEVADPEIKARIQAKAGEENPLSGTSYNRTAFNYDYRLRNQGASLRYVLRLATAESIRFAGGGSITRKVCRNAQCN